jgi:DNA-binding response OmpR family regulator
MSDPSDATSPLTHVGATRSRQQGPPLDAAQTNPAGTPRYQRVDPQTLAGLGVLRIGDIELHVDEHQLIVRGKPVHLPHKEFMILRQMMDNAGRVVTRRELLDNAWGPNCGNPRSYLEVHIRRLRKKIDSDARQPSRIRTVRGVGYVFDWP